jgi:Uncharacterized protein conserved in bacteria (DUF2147)
MMKKLLAIATLLLASTAAQAQYTFEYGGHTIRIDPDRGTVQIPGVYDNTGKHSKRAKGEDSATNRKPKSQEAKTDSQSAKSDSQPTAVPAPAPAEQAAAPAAAAVAVPAAPAATTGPSTTTAAIAPADTAVAPLAPPPPPSAPPQVNQQDAAPPPAPAPTIAAAPPSSPSPPPSAVVQASSPVGVWLTEEKEGKVRIEQCGANLCGYSVDKKSNQNGEQVLINMKPGKDKWSGRILDPSTGSTYDSTIALKGSGTLRVQGCAFGGVFCGGQTWTRVN